MTTAEKLIAVAENVKKVYEAGKAAGGGKLSFLLIDGRTLTAENNFQLMADGTTVSKILAGATVAWEQSPFYSVYQRVQYLKSSGTQYINTLYVPKTDNLKITAKYQYYVGQEATSIFGSQGIQEGVGTFYSIVPYKFVTNTSSLYVGKSGNSLMFTAETGIDIDLSVETNNGVLTRTVNGATESIDYSPPIYKGCPIAIFANFDSGTALQHSSIFLYELSIYDNGELICQFVPCYRKTDAKPGLYDLVRNGFFENAGTGEFEFGPDADPATEADYLDALSTLGVDV